jgi:hypothetical protein
MSNGGMTGNSQAVGLRRKKCRCVRAGDLGVQGDHVAVAHWPAIGSVRLDAGPDG